MSWTTTPSPTLHPAWISGNWYWAGRFIGQAGAAVTLDVARFYPFQITRAVTMSDLAAVVTTLHAANNFQLAIYASGAAGRPTGSPLAVTGNISTAATGEVSGDITGANVTLQPGVYWAGLNSSGSTAVFLAVSSLNNLVAELFGTPNLTSLGSSSNIPFYYVTTPLTFGTWGNLTAAVWTEVQDSAMPAIAFKAV